MQTIVEHGLLIEDKDNPRFSEAKTKIDRFAAKIRQSFPTGVLLHEVSLSAGKYLSCFLVNGKVNFGIYYSDKKELHRQCTCQDILSMTDNIEKMMLSRLDNARHKEINLYPLKELWNKSLEKEQMCTSINGIIYPPSPSELDVSLEEISGETKTPRIFFA